MGVTYGPGVAYEIEFDPTCDGVYQVGPWAPQFYDDAVDGNSASEFPVTSSLTVTVPTPTLVRGASLTGTISEPDGSPAANVCVLVISPGPAYSYIYEALTDGQGAYSFPDLAAVGWTLLLDPTCGGQEPSDFVDQITAGDSGASVAVSVGQSVTYNESLVPAITLPSITPAAMQAATDGSPYSQGFTAAGGTAPDYWIATGLPSGLSIDPYTGVVSGTPSQTGEFNVTISATDSSGQFVTANETALLVVAAPTSVSSVSTSGEARSPLVAIRAHTITVSKDATAGVHISCMEDACSGTLKLTETVNKRVKVKIKRGIKTVIAIESKPSTVVLGTARFSMKKGASAIATVVLNSTGKKVLASVSTKAPFHGTLVSSVRGGKTVKKRLLVV